MLHIKPLSADAFASYIARSIEQYVEDLVQSRNCSDTLARSQAKDEIHRLLPEGCATAGHYIMEIWSDTESLPIGVLWYGIEDSVAFIYDFEIYPHVRRRGYATESLRLLEQEARRLNLSRLELNVFSHNPAARTLYEQAGFQAIETTMQKRIA